MPERQHFTGKASKSVKGSRLVAGTTKRAEAVEKLRKKLKARSKGVKVFADPEILVKSGRRLKASVLTNDQFERINKDGYVIIDMQESAASERRLQEGEGSLQIISDLLGGSQVLGSQVKSDLEAHERLHQGLPRAALNSLVDKLHYIESDEVSTALGMSLRTLQRHRSEPDALLDVQQSGRLDVQQSGRAWTFAEILAKATHVLGSQDEAEQWLRRPAIGLDQQRPIDLLTTPAGVKLVEDYLGRLEYDGYT
jgi:putative toxin-antitoxin system antitoxin component (TIGR02293 family)